MLGSPLEGADYDTHLKESFNKDDLYEDNR